MIKIPRAYPNGMPLYWMDEQSGVLRAAIEAYLDRSVDMTDDQLALLIDYCDYWVSAPSWAGRGIGLLQSKIKEVKTARDLAKWFVLALKVGIDPI